MIAAGMRQQHNAECRETIPTAVVKHTITVTQRDASERHAKRSMDASSHAQPAAYVCVQQAVLLITQPLRIAHCDSQIVMRLMVDYAGHRLGINTTFWGKLP
ncbi:hypothetical protein FOZ61_002202 [Perkinsus olseni]|uniref:Uncharacterized protein n=1 Tax=Perkinsus olseni TaxID=32597 RepID=A0A7J6MEM4_PEROL|nr:hypothetical protein FOZ61_002202 [Perkinsus olseni]KAF4675207.1 hypothetical protein FOL46_002473 [Perkinsus olseni]